MIGFHIHPALFPRVEVLQWGIMVIAPSNHFLDELGMSGADIMDFHQSLIHISL
jgi:hypothetical protein